MKLLYSNSLSDKDCVNEFIYEGNVIREVNRGLILSNGDDLSKGDHAHWTTWLNHEFPDNICITWEFKPLSDEGLCMFFFSALGLSGESIFDEKLDKRDGFYPQYHSGDINTYHISYYRRKYESERYFETCNLRKSKGFKLVAQGADPIPYYKDAIDFYQIKVVKQGRLINFFINDLLIFKWEDEEDNYWKDGYIGFRQMAPMKAIYRNLNVFQLE